MKMSTFGLVKLETIPSHRAVGTEASLGPEWPTGRLLDEAMTDATPIASSGN